MDACDYKKDECFRYIYNIGNVNKSTKNYGALYGWVGRLKVVEAYYLKGSCSKAGTIGFGASGTPVELEADEMMTLEEFISNYMTY